MNEYKYWVSAKGLRKLLNPLTRNDKVQAFDDWRQSVSNISRLKEWEDYIKQTKLSYQNIVNDWEVTISEISEIQKRKKKSGVIPIKDSDYILTLRAGEYCATLTKGDAGDLYRRFIFDIKDEFIRLVFRWGKSIGTRNDFTKSISQLDWMQKLQEKEQGKIYADLTNYVYQKLIWYKAMDYKEINDLDKKVIAKHYFTKEGLLDLEKIESKIAPVIEYNQPKSKEEIEWMIDKFIINLSK